MTSANRKVNFWWLGSVGATALGITLPESIPLRPDEVIRWHLPSCQHHAVSASGQLARRARKTDSGR